MSIFVIGKRSACFIQVGLFPIPSFILKGGDSIGLFKVPLMSAVKDNSQKSKTIKHAVHGVSPRAACHGGALNGNEK